MLRARLRAGSFCGDARAGEDTDLNKEEKAALVDEIADRLGDASAIFAVDYRGISVPQAAELRSQLSEADATFRVVKNRLAKRAVERAGTPELDSLLGGGVEGGSSTLVARMSSHRSPGHPFDLPRSFTG